MEDFSAGYLSRRSSQIVPTAPPCMDRYRTEGSQTTATVARRVKYLPLPTRPCKVEIQLEGEEQESGEPTDCQRIAPGTESEQNQLCEWYWNNNPVFEYTANPPGQIRNLKCIFWIFIQKQTVKKKTRRTSGVLLHLPPTPPNFKVHASVLVSTLAG